MTVIKLWRCSECGKWSHAKRKPKFHRKHTEDFDDLPDDKVIDIESGYRSPWNRDDPDYYQTAEVKCGPFDEYEAVKKS